jgi:tripartite-type tricarboxylate transporter receptor subunit TctC
MSTAMHLSTALTFTRRALGACALALLAGGTVQAQSAWPDKPIRVILPFPPGGPSDIVIRIVSEKLQTSLKQPIVVENRAGAGGNLGVAEVARATPDGHTWLWVPDSVITVNPHVYKQLGFKVDDLVPVSLATQFSSTLVCNPKLGLKSVAEFIARAKSTSMTYASGGAGVPGHLSMELMKSMAGFDMTHVPYKGPAPAMQDVLGGQVDCGLLAGPTVLPHVRSGRLTALGVSGLQRSAMLPEVPTIDEAGVKGYRADFGLVLFAPKGTPEAIVTRFRAAFVDALKQPDVVEKLKASDQQVVAATPAETARSLAEDSKKWGEVARRIKLGLD